MCRMLTYINILWDLDVDYVNLTQIGQLVFDSHSRFALARFALARFALARFALARFARKLIFLKFTTCFSISWSIMPHKKANKVRLALNYQFRNKNVVNLINSYLVEPPKLPFLKELKASTFEVHNELDQIQYYTNGWMYIGFYEMYRGTYGLHRFDRTWKICG
jgi:hypothetical protein